MHRTTVTPSRTDVRDGTSCPNCQAKRGAQCVGRGGKPRGRWKASYTGPDGQFYEAPKTFAAKVDAEAWVPRGSVRQADRTLVGVVETDADRHDRADPGHVADRSPPRD